MTDQEVMFRTGFLRYFAEQGISPSQVGAALRKSASLRAATKTAMMKKSDVLGTLSTLVRSTPILYAALLGSAAYGGYHSGRALGAVRTPNPGEFATSIRQRELTALYNHLVAGVKEKKLRGGPPETADTNADRVYGG